MKKDNWLLIFSFSAILIGFALLIWMYQNKEVKELGDVTKKAQESLVRAYSPKLGSETAKVEIVEFFDPECESCRMFYPFVKKIMAEHNNQIRLVLRYALFHGNSRMAATMLEASREQNKYWETLEYFLEMQPNWGSHHDPRPDLLWQYAKDIGLDIDKLKIDMEKPEIMQKLQQDMEDVMSLQVKQTPTFFVNGERLMIFGYDSFYDLVLKHLEK